MIKLLRWSGIIVCLAFANAYASVVQEVDGTGKLTGATGVDVGGTLYDVEFLDGTCAAIFSVCDAAHFAFTTLAGAVVASHALLDQVFLNTVAGLFDTHPELTSGCPDGASLCFANTPYNADISTTNFIAAENVPSVTGDAVIATSLASDYDTSSSLSSGVFVWARWTSQPESVPEPGTMACLGVGLLALVLTRRQRTQKRVRTQ